MELEVHPDERPAADVVKLRAAAQLLRKYIAEECVAQLLRQSYVRMEDVGKMLDGLHDLDHEFENELERRRMRRPR